MCIIITSNLLSNLTNEWISEAMKINTHGASLAILDSKGFNVFRFMHKPQEIIKIRNSMLRKIGDIPFIFHARIATHGTINATNAHPFRITHDPRIATARGKQRYYELSHRLLFHNGIIENFGSKEYSDTVDFCCNVAAKISYPALDKLLQSLGCKFAIGDPITRKIKIYGYGWQEKTLNQEKVFFSNSTAFPYVPVQTSTTTRHEIYNNSPYRLDPWRTEKSRAELFPEWREESEKLECLNEADQLAEVALAEYLRKEKIELSIEE